MPNILLFGAGAVGIVYTYILRDTNLTAVCRSNYTAARDNGFTINSELYGKVHTKPEIVSSVPSDEVYDYILITAKSLPGIASLIAPALKDRPNTAIVLAQNGIKIEDEYAQTFPNNPILSCVVYLPTSQSSPGVVKMGNIERLEIGSFPSSASNQHAEAFADIWKAGGGNPVVYDDIQPLRWSKLLINASWNPICALSHSSDREVLDSSPYGGELVWEVMKEVVELAKAAEIEGIDEMVARNQLQRAKDRIIGVVPSMLQDVRAGRRMEVEVLVGNAVRLAEELGVKVVLLRAVYAMIKALDESIGRR